MIKKNDSTKEIPLVSICCLTYNHVSYIRETLESFMMQKTNFTFEVLVHDDASTDGTKDIVKEFEEKYPDIIKPIYQTENQYSKGVSMSVTYNFPRVKGKYIAMCEGDDYWTDPNKLQKQVDLLENNSNYSACFHSVNWLENRTEQIYEPCIKKEFYDENDVLQNILQNTVCSTVFKTDAIKNKMQYISEIPYGDMMLHILNARHGHIAYIDEPMATYRRHGNGVYSGAGEIERLVKTIQGLNFIKDKFNYHDNPTMDQRLNLLKQKLTQLSEQRNTNEKVSKNISDQKLAVELFNSAQQKLKDERFFLAKEEMELYKQIVNYNFFNLSDNREINNPKLSVVIVAYNTNELLIDCIKSAQKNKSKDYEIIVVDNGLNNKVEEQLKSLPILYIKCPTNFILSEGRNIGVHFAKGKIITFLDDDALVPDNYVASIVEAFETYNIVGLRGVVLPKTENKNNELAKHYNLGNTPIPAAVDTEGNSAFLIDKYLEAGGMNPLLFGGEGTELSYRLAKLNSITSTIYWPKTIIYHDYASTNDKLENKNNRHKLMHNYMVHLHSDVYAYHASLSKYGSSDKMREQGEKKIPMHSINKNILYSICIPTYNRAKILERAINSALNQTYRNFEIVIVDDGSTDETKEIIESFNSDKINYTLLNHVGAPSARNEAVRQAKGEYILWLDSDDEMTPDMLAEYNRILSSSDEFNILYCNNVRVFDETGGNQEIKYNDINGKLTPEKLLSGPKIANCGALIKKSLIEQVGFYNEEFKRAHDYEFWVKALPFASYKHVDKVLYYQHFHNYGNLSPIYHEKTDLSYEKRIINYLIKKYSIKEMFPHIDWLNLNSKKLKEVKALIYTVYADALNKWNDNEKALEFIEKSLKHKNTDDGLHLSIKIKNELKWERKNTLPITAIISAYNEGDVIYHVIKDLVEQDIDVYFIDNNSTDNTVTEVEKLLGKGVIRIEQFPQDSNYDVQSDKYVWRYLLKRKEDISNTMGRGWYIHADADEFREAPWKNLTLREGIEKVNGEGCNAINFKIYDFKPFENNFDAGNDVRKYIKHYSKEIHPYNNLQVKAWKNFGQAINLWENGGHNIQFLDRKVYPMPFILRHYSIRSQEHGIKKIFDERKNRYDKVEKDAKWHQHYDHIEQEDYNLLTNKADLTLYNRNKACTEIQSGRFNFSENIPERKNEMQNKKTKNNSNNNSEDKYYKYTRPEVQAMVNPNSKRILDVGCASGAMASELKTKLKAEVWGIEYVEDAAKKAAEILDRVLVGTVEANLEKIPNEYFDTIIFADVLEHLTFPEKVLEQIKTKLKPDGEIVASIPNVRHWSVLLDLVQGHWNYTDAGLLDNTHFKFFTRNSIAKMFKGLGLEDLQIGAVSLPPTNPNHKNVWDKFKSSVNGIGLDTETLAAEGEHYQYLVKAKSKVAITPTELVSIIVPVFNQQKYTQQFVESVYEFTDTPFELIIVDDGSDKGTIEYLKEIEQKEEVKIIYNKINNGFPISVNQGITASKGKYVLIANNDIVVTKNWLTGLLNAVNKDDSIGLAGPTSNAVSGLQIDNNAKYSEMEEMHKYAEQVSSKNKNQILEFPRLAFLCTLIKREVIDKIGGLDERFSPGNFEDDDFCLRSQLSGYKAVIARDVFVHHYGSVSFKANGENKYAERLKTNEKIFVKKWGSNVEGIWLKGEKVNERKLECPINQDLFNQSIARAFINIDDEEYDLAIGNLNLAIENYDDSKRVGYENLSKEEILNLAGTILLSKNELEDAKEYFEKELETDPNSSTACFGLGEVFYQAEMIEESKSMFEWAVVNDNGNQDAQGRLIEVNTKLNLPIEHNAVLLETINDD